jgi:mannose-1-phosphate guanylyltransferase
VSDATPILRLNAIITDIINGEPMTAPETVRSMKAASSLPAIGAREDDSYGKTWAIVLAGGDGNRLRALTTTSNGVAVPKQYCSVWGDACLLEDAILRGSSIAPLRRTCAVVAAPHRRWWSTALAHLPHNNVIVQPQNRGTGIGILLSLLHVLSRDPYANVVLLPADHYLQDESIMAASLQEVADLAAHDADGVYLLGAEPVEPDPELGYIVPTHHGRDKALRVSQFVEMPTFAEAASLEARGALLNVFIVAGTVGALLGMYKKSHANAVASLSSALTQGSQAFTRVALSELYEYLIPIDFSHDVLTGQEGLLRVLPVARCGWTDLGTPDRVAQVLRRAPRESRSSNRSATGPYLSLATQSLARA